jgi:hypothetical protein
MRDRFVPTLLAWLLIGLILLAGTFALGGIHLGWFDVS